MRTNMTKASVIAIALISGVLLGTSMTLMASAEVKADQPHSSYVTQPAIHRGDDYLPAHFAEEEHAAQEQPLPAQF
jgi:hypothetical protein